ncbi:MAG: serine/threonine protein kinase [Planctomycetota bacterium]|nr:MAG: serine/threonine protein kinase [Planctomycetota bacterium]
MARRHRGLRTLPPTEPRLLGPHPGLLGHRRRSPSPRRPSPRPPRPRGRRAALPRTPSRPAEPRHPPLGGRTPRRRAQGLPGLPAGGSPRRPRARASRAPARRTLRDRRRRRTPLVRTRLAEYPGCVQFALGRKLGRGPVGASYAARLADGRHAVAKVITRRFRQNQRLLEEVLKDLRSFVGFRNPNAVETIAVTRYEDRDVVLYAPLRGETLARLLERRRPLDVQLALRIARDVGLCLAHAHQRGLAVGDLRPEKVAFDPQAGAAVLDLGQFRASCLAAGYGQYGLTFGHPGYLAPEAIQEGLYQPTTRTDVYALGVLFYQLVNGELPFPGDPTAQLHAHLERPLPPPTHSSEVTPSLARWMLRMTAKRPAERYADGMAVVNSLYELLGKPGPFPVDRATVSSGSWEREAAVRAKPPENWSESKVVKASAVVETPALDELYASGLLEQQELRPEAEAEPEPEPAQAAAQEPFDPHAQVKVKLGEKLARGPVGASYRGWVEGDPTERVVKVVTRRFERYPDLLEQILGQLRRAQSVEHSTLVNVRHVVRVGGRDVVVMDRAEGRTLRSVLRAEGRLNFSKALGITKTLAQALAAIADGRTLSHGDIRPEKVYVTEAGKARLADLGFASASALAANYGQYGMYFGHPSYLAPEVMQEKKREPDLASDMYAIGVLLYEMVCGQPPFRGRDPRETLLLHLKQKPPPPPRELAVPTPLAELILQLLSKSPAIRPSSPRALVDAVTRVQKQVLLTTGLRKVVAVDEFDLADSGDEASGAQWTREAVRHAEKTGTWSRDKIGKALGQDFSLGELTTSEELDPHRNPFHESG